MNKNRIDFFKCIYKKTDGGCVCLTYIFFFCCRLCCVFLFIIIPPPPFFCCWLNECDSKQKELISRSANAKLSRYACHWRSSFLSLTVTHTRTTHTTDEMQTFFFFLPSNDMYKGGGGIKQKNYYRKQTLRSCFVYRRCSQCLSFLHHFSISISALFILMIGKVYIYIKYYSDTKCCIVTPIVLTYNHFAMYNTFAITDQLRMVVLLLFSRLSYGLHTHPQLYTMRFNNSFTPFGLHFFLETSPLLFIPFSSQPK